MWEDRNGRCNDLFTGNGGWEKADAGCRIVFFSLAFLYKEFLFFRVCVWAAKKRNWIPQPAAPFFFSNNCTIHFCTWKSTPDDRREHVDRENRLNQHTNIPECRLKCRLLGSSTYNNIFFVSLYFLFFFFIFSLKFTRNNGGRRASSCFFLIFLFDVWDSNWRHICRENPQRKKKTCLHFLFRFP